jgi:urea transport system ATP-binding protein
MVGAKGAAVGQTPAKSAAAVAAEAEAVGATETNGDGAKGHGDSLQQRLSRIALMTRKEPTNLTNGDLLKVEGVKVLFDGFKALDVDAFSLGFYELRVVIGPNGAGKTTLCDVISGKTRSTAGSVTFAGRELTHMVEAEIARLGVGRKFQTPTVFDSLSVYQNMELALPGRQGLLGNLFTRETPVEREKIFKILNRVRLAEHADRQVKYLSHGQRQWLEISMLILSSPMLLLVDEPAAGLTDEETVLTAELLLELQDEHSIIVIEHDMDFVRLLGSRVTVLNEGQVMAFGTMEQVQADPKVIEAYLGR